MDPTGAHHLDEIVERCFTVVRHADQIHAPRASLRLQPPEMLAPRDEVVHLLDLHTPAEEPELRLEL